MTADDPAAALVCTIGHSNRTLEAFIELLQQNAIERVLDVRTFPRSRRNPHFNIDLLPGSLAEVGINHTHLPALGGRRRTSDESPNKAWRNASFRGYADHMQSAEFRENVDWVAQQAQSELCVLMCAEAVPWRCHRSLIGDALLVRGIAVEDIIGPGARRPHTLTSFAKVDGTTIIYPPIAEQTELF